MALESLLIRMDVPEDVKEEIRRNISERKQVEEALREGENRFRRLAENAQDMIYRMSLPDGKYDYVSPASNDIIGYTPEELYNGTISIYKVIHPDYAEYLDRQWNNLLKGKVEPFYEYKIIHKDGGERWLHQRNVLVRDKSGSPIAIEGIVTDITERKKTEEELLSTKILLEQTFEQSPVPMVLVTMPDAIIRIVNPAFREFVGIQDEPIYYGTSMMNFKPSYQDYDSKGNAGSIKDLPLARSLAGQKTSNEERKIVRKDGTIRWELVSGTPIYNTNGEIIAGYLILIDITERKRVEEAMWERGQHLSSIYNTVGDVIFYLKVEAEGNYRFLSVNQAFCNVTGLKQEQVVGRMVHEVIPEPSLTIVLENYKQAIYNKKIIRWEETSDYPTGQLIGEVSIAPVIDEKGRCMYLVGSVHDITERKRAEEVFRFLSTRQEAILTAVPDIIMEVDNSKVYTWANREGFNFFGEDVLGKEAAFYFEGEQNTYNNVQPLFNGSEDVIYVESWQRRRDGKKRLLSWWCRVLKDETGNVTGALSSAHDITEERLAEEQVRKLNRIYLVLSNINQAIIRIHDIQQLFDKSCRIAIEDGEFRMAWIGEVNRNTHKVDVAASAGTIDDYLYKINIDLNDERRSHGPTGRAVKSGIHMISNDILNDDTMLPWKEDAIRLGYGSSGSFPVIVFEKVEYTINFYSDEPGFFDEVEIKLLDELAMDISFALEFIKSESDRKMAEESLLEKTMELDNYFTNALDLFCIADTDGYFLRLNKEWETIFGYKIEELEGKRFLDLVHPDDLNSTLNAISKLENQKEVLNFINRYRCKDGSYRWLEWRSTPAGKLIYAAARDITERKEAENELKLSNKHLGETLVKLEETQRQVLQQERLRSLGQMASGIAHDINNSLTPIMGYVDLLMDDEEFMMRNEKALNMILKSTKNIANTIGRLKQFYKINLTGEKLCEIDINKLVNNTIDLTSHRWKSMAESTGSVIEIIQNLENDLPLTKIDESEITEALTNLILNACDAMIDGGILILKTFKMEDNIVIEVKDTGIGMDDETLKHCMDPFFTTKGNLGTGLGLSMVFGVIDRHKGKVEIESERNKGTMVRLILPIDLTKKEEKNIDEILRFTQHLRILNVEDDESISDMLKQMLKKRNHEVEVSSNGKSGLELYKQELEKGMPFNLVITDLGMAGMDGISLSKMIKELTPSVPIILLTGWGTLINKHEFPTIDYLLKKPIMQEDLFRAINELFKK